jgi:hypothetical protein
MIMITWNISYEFYTFFNCCLYATAHIILIQFTASSMYVFSCLVKSIICKGISYPRYKDIILPRYAASHEPVCGFAVSARVLCVWCWAAQWRVFRTPPSLINCGPAAVCTSSAQKRRRGHHWRAAQIYDDELDASILPRSRERVRNADSGDGPCVIGSGWVEADSKSRERTHTQSGHRSAQRITKGPLVLASPSHFSRPTVNQLIIPQRADHRWLTLIVWWIEIFNFHRRIFQAMLLTAKCFINIWPFVKSINFFWNCKCEEKTIIEQKMQNYLGDWL